MCAVRDDKGFNRKDLRWMGFGLEFCTVILLFSFAGYGLDVLIENDQPEFLITGFFVGFVLMFYWIIKSTKELRK